MLFTSFDFFVFLPIVVCVLFAIPTKMRITWLLLTSYYFYLCWNPVFILYLLGVTTFSYGIGVILGIYKKYKKVILSFGIIGCLALLIILKYLGLFTNTKLDIVVPVGISFYLFQAMGYMIDVYRGKKVQKNLVLYALYIGFFPQLTSGPIEHADRMIMQFQALESKKLWDFERVKNGMLLILWGMFQKTIIADRIGFYVDSVFENCSEYGMITIATAVLLYSFQIYCDFDGYTNMARGTAEIIGIELRANFRQPYMATNIKEFWRRWHITLTTWFTEYIYYPLGGNRKGQIRTYFNTMIVFALSGLWHGANWTFMVWGLCHGLAMTLYSLYKRIRGNCSAQTSFSSNLIYKTVNFMFVTIAWMFFRADSFDQIKMLIDQSLHAIGDIASIGAVVGDGDWRLIVAGLMLLFTVDAMHERGMRIREWIAKQQIWFRFALYLGIICAIVFCGVQTYYSGVRTFIYFKF